jgi:antibiotic biosynthesis monooxygenase (ABM) superfamily enzyme
VIVRQVTLKVPLDRQAELAAFFRDEYRAAMSRQPGFLAARLLKVSGVDDELQIELEFAGEEQAAAWRASPDHVRLSPRLKAFSPVLALKVLSPLA